MHTAPNLGAVREPPINISKEMLRAYLQGEYGLVVAELDFLDLGADSSAWVYRLRTLDRTYFLKVRRRVTNPASLVVPRALHEQGITHVIAPLPNTAGELWTRADEYALILYPFIEGRTGMQHGMSAQQWMDFGALLRQVHDATIAPDLVPLIQHDTFAPTWPGLVRRLDAHLDARAFDDPPAQELATFWRAYRQTIQTLLAAQTSCASRLRRNHRTSSCATRTSTPTTCCSTLAGRCGSPTGTRSCWPRASAT